MNRWKRAAVAACTLLCLARPADAASAVFAGDPTNPADGKPFEILPGEPLVTAGADGRLGTADDVVDRSKVGDIDLVVRLGPLPAGNEIPAPAPLRGSLATAVAGARGAGTALPFRVYLSDGSTTPARPYGNVLNAADLEGHPVVVLVFADLDGDGRIGPTRSRPGRAVRALRELEPVGREVALFHDGVASGTVTLTVGGRPGRGGVAVVAGAVALTGDFDDSFFEGLVPTGAAITTALPFLPERQLDRVFSRDLGPLEVGGTLNPMPHAAGVPDPRVLDLALPTDGSSPTTDTALAVAGPAVCARLVDYVRSNSPVPSEPAALLLGPGGRASRARLRLVAVDRFGNPTDPAAPLAVRVVASGPLAVSRSGSAPAAERSFTLAQGKGQSLVVAARAAGEGELDVLVRGARCQELRAVVRSELAPANVDARVALDRAAAFHSIAGAVAAATDRNGDGRIVIAVGEGLYREQVRVTRPVELYGAGAGRTVIDAGGGGPALVLAHPAALAVDLTASGGTVGVSVEAPIVVRDLEARDNIGAGVRITASGASVSGVAARGNGAGVAVQATADLDTCTSHGNYGAGITVRGASAGVRDSASFANGGDGIEVTDSADPTLTGNRIAGNLGTGLTLENTSAGVLTGNSSTGNDDNGLRLNQSNGALIDGNDFSTNGGFGMRIDRSTADFDAAPGAQGAPGNNDVSDNRKGELRLD